MYAVEFGVAILRATFEQKNPSKISDRGFVRQL
jgi:hypothetical protein